MINLPKLSADGLRHISVCSFVEIPESDRRECAYSKQRCSNYSKTKASDGQEIYCRRIIELTSDNEGHFHVEAVIAEVMEEAPYHEDPLESVLGIEEAFAGKPVTVTVRGRYRMGATSSITKRIASALLGVTVDVSSYKLSLSGCTFDVTGDGPLKKVRWLSVDDETLSLELTLSLSIFIDEKFLTIPAVHLNNAFKSLSSTK